MNDLPIRTAVLILQYDAENKYGVNAAQKARDEIRKQKGVVEISPDVFIIEFAENFRFLSGLVIEEDRIFVGSAETRHLYFVLVPCQSPVVGALTEEAKTKLAELGLKYLEIGYPEAPREVRR